MASLPIRTKLKPTHWTYDRLVDRLIELGFRNVPNSRNCIALEHDSGAKLLLPIFPKGTLVDETHKVMAEYTLTSYRIGTLEPDRSELRRKKRLEKLASEIDDIKNEYATLGMSKSVQKLAEARELIHSV